MEDDELTGILHRYLNGDATEAERLIVDKWYEDMDHNKDLNDDGDFELLESRLWQRIMKTINSR